jgi:hypothetical protein
MMARPRMSADISSCEKVADHCRDLLDKLIEEERATG